jgi:DNA-binding MarR family transcriptional regulator
VTKSDKRNAYLYCKFRDEQYALYDEYAKKNGLLMKTLLVLNALYYAEDGLTQKEISDRTFQSKQTVNLIIKNLLSDNYVTVKENPQNKRNKFVRLTLEGRNYAKEPVVHITWAEDTAMSMFTPEEQEQLISLSRRFTKNLTDLINGNEVEV